jgi:hypothetical protein
MVVVRSLTDQTTKLSASHVVRSHDAAVASAARIAWLTIVAVVATGLQTRGWRRRFPARVACSSRGLDMLSAFVKRDGEFLRRRNNGGMLPRLSKIRI